jgi:hypothetical protein
MDIELNGTTIDNIKECIDTDGFTSQWHLDILVFYKTNKKNIKCVIINDEIISKSLVSVIFEEDTISTIKRKIKELIKEVRDYRGYVEAMEDGD